MYSDYTIDDVLQTASCFVQSIQDTFEYFDERRDSVENLYFAQLKGIFRNEELQNTAQKFIINECKKQEDVRTNLEKNRVYLQTLKRNVAKEREVKLEKGNQLAKLEEDADKIRKKIQSRLKEKGDIDRKKDIILTYKLLTNTSFVYTTKKVTGIVTKKSPKTFSFNPQELSPDEITEKLWQLVLEDKK